jgi:hypothetical protein
VLLPPARHRSLRDAKIVAAYLAGTTGGALLTTTGLWLLSGLAGPLRPATRVALLAAGALVVTLAKVGPLAGKLRLPESRRQIPAAVFGGGLVRGAFRFGLEMGSGVRTYVPSPAPYVLALVVLLGWLPLALALLAAVGFGIGRALPLLAPLAWLDRGAAAFSPSQGRLAPVLEGLLVLAGGAFLV